jgi:putative endonuclease
MSVLTKATGRYGERLAEQHFVALGAELLERNYYRDYSEVDLIFCDAGELVAVEVKTRSVVDFVPIEECVRRSQLGRIARGLTTYAMDNGFWANPWRIDVVLIVLDVDGQTVLRLDHFKSVYPG